MNYNKPKTTALAEQVILAFSAIVTVSTLGWVLWHCRYGIDFTDESFYLVWMSNPFNYSVSVTQFGFIYHPLYELLDGNIATLRRVNILITFCLAWLLGNVFLRTVFEIQAIEVKRRLTISAAFATTSLILLNYAYVSTPSYNSLALQALLVAATGLLLADKKVAHASIAGWFLIGVGGWLAFMAKPTTAAVLGVCSVVYLLLGGKLRVPLLAVPLATAIGLLFLSALTIDGSVFGFIDRLKAGVEMVKILGASHTISHSIRLESLHLSGKERILLILGAMLVASAAYTSQVQNRVLVHIGAMLSAAFALLGMAVVFEFKHLPFNAVFLIYEYGVPSFGVKHGYYGVPSFGAPLIWTIPFGAILSGLAIYQFKGLLKAQWSLALIFLVLPYAYAFGTNNNYWWASTGAGIFWVFSGLALLGQVSSGRRVTALLLPLGLAAQLVTVLLIHAVFEAPYRQPPQPLRNNDYKIEIGKPGSTLVTSKSFGQYFLEAINVGKQAGFKKGTPMIDLTGQSPGILYAMGASSIGQPWMMGGYSGSDAVAEAMLKKVSCQDLAIAWLLAEPEGPVKISPGILTGFGANLATDYEIVGMFNTAEDAGGYKEARVQQLLKPVRSVDVAVTACVAGKITIQ